MSYTYYARTDIGMDVNETDLLFRIDRNNITENNLNWSQRYDRKLKDWVNEGRLAVFCTDHAECEVISEEEANRIIDDLKKNPKRHYIDTERQLNALAMIDG